ncbi:hypothetical protein PLESTB_001421600, partial [Pleodorina starrii]
HEPFSWADQWYPVGFLVDLPTNEPIPFSLFDHKLVVWYQGNGRWACMADECPHRRAPLSRGRLFRSPNGTSGADSISATGAALRGPATPPSSSSSTSSSDGPTILLECAYHGWQFDAEGSCVRLPQMLPPGYPPAAAAAAATAAEAAAAGGEESMAEGGGGGSGGGGGGGGARAATAAGTRRRLPRACSGRAYPTAVAQGMVWVWYGSSTGRIPDESLIPLDFAEIGRRRGEDWALVDVFTRDFPYDWETMVENVVDPSHVAFAHDGTGQGLDRHAAPPLELQISSAGPGGFVGRFRGVKTLPPPASPSPSSTSPSSAAAAAATSSAAAAAAAAPGPTFQPGAWSDLEFRAPCLVSMRFSLPGKGQAGLVLYCVPLGRGRSRMIARLPRNFATGWLAALQPRWAKHLPRMAVLDQDIDLLRDQEAAMARARLMACQEEAAAAEVRQWTARRQHGASTTGAAAEDDDKPAAGDAGAAAPPSSPASSSAASVTAGGDWRGLYVMPAPADRFVVQFRRWLDDTGESRPWALPAGGGCTTATAAAAAAAVFGGAASSDDPLPRERVLDRYHSHVRSCSACSGALANFQRLAAVARLAGLAAVAAAAGVAAAAAAASSSAAAAATTTTASSAAPLLLAAQPPAAAAAAAALALTAVACGLVAAVCERMVRRFQYTEEGRELRMNEDRWLRRLLFSGTNSFNSMVALTNKNS